MKYLTAADMAKRKVSTMLVNCNPISYFGKSHWLILEHIQKYLNDEDLLSLGCTKNQISKIQTKVIKVRKKKTLRRIFTSKKRPSKQEKPDLVFNGKGTVFVVMDGKAILVVDEALDGNTLSLYLLNGSTTTIPCLTAKVPNMVCGTSAEPQPPGWFWANDVIIVSVWDNGDETIKLCLVEVRLVENLQPILLSDLHAYPTQMTLLEGQRWDLLAPDLVNVQTLDDSFRWPVNKRSSLTHYNFHPEAKEFSREIFLSDDMIYIESKMDRSARYIQHYNLMIMHVLPKPAGSDRFVQSPPAHVEVWHFETGQHLFTVNTTFQHFGMAIISGVGKSVRASLIPSKLIPNAPENEMDGCLLLRLPCSVDQLGDAHLELRPNMYVEYEWVNKVRNRVAFATPFYNFGPCTSEVVTSLDLKQGTLKLEHQAIGGGGRPRCKDVIKLPACLIEAPKDYPEVCVTPHGIFIQMSDADNTIIYRYNLK